MMKLERDPQRGKRAGKRSHRRLPTAIFILQTPAHKRSQGTLVHKRYHGLKRIIQQLGIWIQETKITPMRIRNADIACVRKVYSARSHIASLRVGDHG